MKLSAEDRERVEAYAASLLQAAKEEGRELEDLRMISHLADSLVELNDAMREIIEQGDEGLLPFISERYNAMFHEEQAQVMCDVTTAVPMGNELKQEVLTFLGAEYGQAVQLNEIVDPAIIGGIIVSVGGERKDASVRTQLENARQELKQEGAHTNEDGSVPKDNTRAEVAPEAAPPSEAS